MEIDATCAKLAASIGPLQDSRSQAGAKVMERSGGTWLFASLGLGGIVEEGKALVTPDGVLSVDMSDISEGTTTATARFS